MTTAFDLAQRFIGIKEAPGQVDNPHILAMLRLDADWPKGDDVPWCGAFVEYIAWLLRLPRTKTLLARKWLGVGAVVHDLNKAKAAYDVVILKRSGSNQPGPNVLDAPGHVGFFAGLGYIQNDLKGIFVLGGNQKDAINIRLYHIDRVLGVRRLKGA